jgi:zinc protease
MDTPITRFTLSNGLLVVLKEIHTAPLVSHWIWYRVGSRDETPGGTGLSHWVEHMQFKGTPRYPTGVLDKAIARNGGVWNAFTYLDWTAYFETLPANQVDLAMQIEADRMTESLFDRDEFEAERTVIISEREGNENEPTFRLSEEVQAAAFRVHAYHHEIIGDMADLETIQRDDLYHHYHTYYAPNNAVLTIAGDFETAAMIQRVREYYETISIGNHPPRLLRSEPDQTGQRSIQVEGPGETTYLEAAYHVPVAMHADFLALNVLDSLLSGPSDLSIFGSGLSNKTSRLYRALVEKELAVSVFGGLQATIDPYLYNISIIVHPESSPEAAMAALDQEISRLQEKSPTVDELARAVKQARALFAYSTESITNQAAYLGFVEMFADQTWLASYLERLALVSPQDVQRVAQTYLRPQNRVLGVYIPTGVGA